MAFTPQCSPAMTHYWLLEHNVSQKPRIDISANDTFFFIPLTQEAVRCLSSLSSSALIFGLCVSWPNTKIQNTGSGAQPTEAAHRSCIISHVVLTTNWSDRYLSPPTKVRVYQTLVLPILTYACQTWTLPAADIQRLEAFHMKCQ